MICANSTRSRCKTANHKHQPDDQFIGLNGRLCVTCATCRDYQNNHIKKKAKRRKARREPGGPVFETEGDRVMYEKWLRGLLVEAKGL